MNPIFFTAVFISSFIFVRLNFYWKSIFLFQSIVLWTFKWNLINPIITLIPFSWKKKKEFQFFYHWKYEFFIEWKIKDTNFIELNHNENKTNKKMGKIVKLNRFQKVWCLWRIRSHYFNDDILSRFIECSARLKSVADIIYTNRHRQSYYFPFIAITLPMIYNKCDWYCLH